MGGRGSSSGGLGGGGIKGLHVNMNGKEMTYFFNSKDGINFYSRGLGENPQKTPNNMSAKEFKERIESNGAITRVIGEKEYRKIETDYKKKREETSKELNISWFRDAPRPRKGWKGH